MKTFHSHRRGYWSLLWLQTQNAFNDKMAQFLIIPLAFWLGNEGREGMERMPHLLAILLVLPYLLFAPLAGWLADRFPKTSIIRGAAIAQTFVLVLMWWAVREHALWSVVTCFGLLSIQSSILNPAKRGSIKELVGEEGLGSASGYFEMMVVLAVCAGQIMAGFCFSHGIGAGESGWEVMQSWILVLCLLSLVPLVLGWSLPLLKPHGVKCWDWRVPLQHADQIRRMVQNISLRRCAIGKSFFWGSAGVLNLWQILIANDIAIRTGASHGSVLSSIMVAASGGIIAGGSWASWLSRGGIRLSLVWHGGLGMILGVVLLAFFTGGGPMSYVAFFVTGCGGAIFLVPLNGQLQNLAPANESGRVLAGASLLDCAAGLSVVVGQYLLQRLGVPIGVQCLGLACATGGILVYLIPLLPVAQVRRVIIRIASRIYKVDVQGESHIPREGGVLLAPNHISYLDTFILSLSCPRPIRFLMVEDCFRTPGVGIFARYFDTISISRKRAKEAIALAGNALREGAVVCIFPEGQLSHTGALSEIKRGFQMIAKRGQCPVVPVYMDGLWGHQLSFERETMLWKVPQRYPGGIRVHFGSPLIGDEEVSPKRMGQSLHALSHEAFSNRRPHREQAWMREQIAQAKLPNSVRERLSQESWHTLQPAIFNAIQLRELGGFRERMRIGITDGEPAERVVGLLALLSQSRLDVISLKRLRNINKAKSYDCFFTSQVVKGMERDAVAKIWIQMNGETIPEGEERPAFFPALVNGEGNFVACSMPHPPKLHSHDRAQPGWKAGSYGRVLPGTQVVPEECDKEFFLGSITNHVG